MVVPPWRDLFRVGDARRARVVRVGRRQAGALDDELGTELNKVSQASWSVREWPRPWVGSGRQIARPAAARDALGSGHMPAIHRFDLAPPLSVPRRSKRSTLR